MKKLMVGLLAETPLHPGAEGTAGVIDLPVAREAVTGYPVIPGSSLKGALRDKAEQLWVDSKNVLQVFGRQDSAGGVTVTDARLVLLPVRSLTSHYFWATCPYLLERFVRDSALLGSKAVLDIPHVNKGEAISQQDGRLFLEELVFESRSMKQQIADIASVLQKLVRHDSVRNRLANQLVIISDDDFAYFARYGLAVNARNHLDNTTKSSNNLWYEEVIPADTLFYALLLERPQKQDCLSLLVSMLEETPYLQVGGNETVGQGWCVLSCTKEDQ